MCYFPVPDAGVGNSIISAPWKPKTVAFQLGANNYFNGDQQVNVFSWYIIISLACDGAPNQLMLLWFHISSLGGLILDRTIANPKFEGVVLYSPVINGG